MKSVLLGNKMLLKFFGPELDTKAGLEKLYYSHSSAEICRMFNINGRLLYRRLKRFRIKIKGLTTTKITKEYLVDLYNNRQLSREGIVKTTGLSRATIDRLFRKYSIHGRNFREASLLRSNLIQEQMRKQWSDPSYRKKMMGNYSSIKEKMAFLSQNQLGKISSIQKILYSILNDLNIKYEPEKIIGFWTYDCYLPDYNLIIECQGDYWHSMNKARINDTAKATYLEKYFPDLRIKHIWEHEFMCKNRIIDLIKYWTDKKKVEMIDFNFSGVIINEIDDEEAKLFISKYHYFGRIGRSSTKYGAYVNDTLVAVCCFASITRTETAINYGLKPKEMRELTRFCIHPSYQKHNFATWIISKCIKMLKNKLPHIKKLVSFTDTTYNHYGTIYKASNWKLDRTVKPDYWYSDSDGYIMHKKTLWDHAQKMGVTEHDYAQQNNYRQVWGKEKKRFIFDLI